MDYFVNTLTFYNNSSPQLLFIAYCYCMDLSWYLCQKLERKRELMYLVLFQSRCAVLKVITNNVAIEWYDKYYLMITIIHILRVNLVVNAFSVVYKMWMRCQIFIIFLNLVLCFCMVAEPREIVPVLWMKIVWCKREVWCHWIVWIMFKKLPHWHCNGCITFNTWCLMLQWYLK